MNEPVAAVFAQFALPGKLSKIESWGAGHIHDTFRVSCGRTRYILQRINTRVFKDPVALMQNVQRVTAHLQHKQGDRAVRLIAARDGAPFVLDPDGQYWRLFNFVEGTCSYESVRSAAQAHEAARAFGRFLRWMADLPPPRLHPTIPHFHETLHRHAALEKAINADPCQRVAAAEPEIAFALKHEREVCALMETPLPERIAHNDCKLNNVLFDEKTAQAVCVVDLDTVMPASALYDFGDLVRGSGCTAAEDERDLTKVRLDLGLFEALARGYFAEAGSLLSALERQMLVLAGKLITFETGLRFLTDHLCGDTYFKIHRPDHNLDRCRTQFRLVASIEQQQPAMERLVANL